MLRANQKVGRSIALPILGLAVALFLLSVWTLAFEGFGTSPGTMVQLATSHVPTEEDERYLRTVYPRVVRKEVANLTGGDPGPLRPWIFPWSGRGITLIATG